MTADDRSKSASRTRLGVNVKLQTAFGAVAMLTVIAAAVAIFSFSSIKLGFERVAGHEVPVMTDALQLSVVSGEIAAAAARFVNTKTVAEQAPIAAAQSSILQEPERSGPKDLCQQVQPPLTLFTAGNRVRLLR